MCDSFGVCFDVGGHFVAALPGHADVDQQDVGGHGVEAGDGLVAVADGHDVDVFVGEGQFDDALNRHAVIGKKQSLRHLGYIGSNKEAR